MVFRMKRLVPYGIMNYAGLFEKQTYFIDKTRYIITLEDILTLLDDLFSHTRIGLYPTMKQNTCIVMNRSCSISHAPDE
jgi:hypothetical protein